MGFKKLDKKFILSDSSVNEYGFRLLTSGYQLASFGRNPIGYYMHQRDGGVTHKWEDLAIEGDNVVAYPVVNLSNPKGQQLADEVENGFLNAASVGHIVVLEYSNDEMLMLPGQTGPTITKWYNKECSLVDIPGNCNALCQLFDNDGNEVKLADLVGGKKQIQNLNSNNMQTIQLTPDVIQALNLASGFDAAAANVAIINLASKAEKAEKDLADFKKQATDKEVNDLLDKALNVDKKITAQLKVKLAAQYEGKPEELKDLLAEMPGFQTVANAVNQKDRNQGGAYTPEVQNLMSEGWDKLDKAGRLPELKAKNEAAYVELYKGKFGYAPNEKPEPKK
jgi:hypothetical protein